MFFQKHRYIIQIYTNSINIYVHFFFLFTYIKVNLNMENVIVIKHATPNSHLKLNVRPYLLLSYNYVYYNICTTINNDCMTIHTSANHNLSLLHR